MLKHSSTQTLKVCSFFPYEMTKKKASITEGAGQFRSCGRLSLTANDNQTLRTSLNNTISSVKNWVGAHDEKYTVDSTAPTQVFVVFSIAGGTGAGLFIDFALLLKGDKNIAPGTKTVAIALLPDVYSSLGTLAANCKPNAITGITEYEFIADGKLADIVSDPNHPARTVLTPGGKYPVEANNLYDAFFVVNNESSTGLKYESSKEMADLISKSLFLAAGATGGTANSALDNNIALKAGQSLRGKMLRYLSLGCAEMFFDPIQVSIYHSLKQAKNLSHKLLYSKSNNLNWEEEIQAKLDDWRLQEDAGRDDILNALTVLRNRPTFTGINEYDENSATAIKSRKDTWIRAHTKNLQETIHNPGGKLDLLTGKSLNLIQTFASEKISTIGGFDYIKQVFSSLKARFQGMMDELVAEKTEFENKLSSLENSYAVKLSDIKDAANISRWNVLKSREKAIVLACEEYVSAVNTEAGYLNEIERRTAAIIFYRKIIERCEEILSRVKNFEDRMIKVLEISTRHIQQIESKNPKEPFTIHVTPEYISSIKNNDPDIDIESFLKKINLSQIAFQEHQEASELFNLLTNYTNELPKTKEYYNTTLLDVLQQMEYSNVIELFKKLKSSIGILRQLDPNYPIDNATSYVIGVYDINHPAILDRSKKHVQEDKNKEGSTKEMPVDILAALDGTGEKSNKIIPTPGDILRSEFKFHGRFPELSNTKDPNKIIVSAYESAVPAFIIRHFDAYASDMEHKNQEIAENLRYSNKHWGDLIMQRKYSIFPQHEDEAIKAWTLAFFVTKVEKEKNGKNAFTFIQKPRNGKYSVYTTTGDRPMMELTAYRPKAYEIFLEGRYGDNILPLLKEKIRNDLETYRKKFEDLRNDYQATLWIDEYSDHKLGKTTYNSEAHKNTREQVMKEFRFLQGLGDISDLL
jgi:hypothetical protein